MHQYALIRVIGDLLASVIMEYLFLKKTQEIRFTATLRNCIFTLQTVTCLIAAGCAKSHDGAGPIKEANSDNAKATTVSNKGKESAKAGSQKPAQGADDGEQGNDLYYDAVSSLPEEKATQDESAPPNTAKRGQMVDGIEKISSSSVIPDDELSQSSELSQGTAASVRSKAKEQVGGIENMVTPSRDPRKEAREILKRVDQRSQRYLKK